MMDDNTNDLKVNIIIIVVFIITIASLSFGGVYYYNEYNINNTSPIIGEYQNICYNIVNYDIKEMTYAMARNTDIEAENLGNITGISTQFSFGSKSHSYDLRIIAINDGDDEMNAVKARYGLQEIVKMPGDSHEVLEAFIINNPSLYCGLNQGAIEQWVYIEADNKWHIVPIIE